jgi:hypothetical protein
LVPRQGEGGESGGDVRRGGVTRLRGTARRGCTMRDEGWTSTRTSWPAATDGDARVSGRGASSGRSDASERGGVSKRGLSSGRGASGRGAARRGGDDDGGRKVRWRFGGKRLNAVQEGDEAYIEPPPFVTGHIPNWDERPISPGLYYDLRLKGVFRTGAP